ncbi:glycosyltransferase family 4 protein [Campylobacter hyointestinalis]|uniref:glycosyltransferase family 4 protein n=1 Tax=Campylobacter hyointestinalis TaxID=198 RepID=UPI0007C92552|nr:glycosyltransferase family 4 protein [Campylobacter hyointestinalis]ANE33477.1 glycosyltransferase, family 1 [Campylobacter hyointestinalis subsp. lawsonii CCUG 27631]RAZ24202.1 glycosyltransferase [Campylobacter hyointestinalis subsp. lawsonii]RAZ38552.1 glycosyltransferase [Campylobacter hyointestinalis subsp. lawsonii]
MLKYLKITHLTSAHSRYDTRIFIKMCSSLAKNPNYIVNLIVADGKDNETKNNVNIIDIGAKTGSRLSRMTKTVKKIFKKAKELNSDIYHLHDPELIPIGIKLKKLGFKVIFDSHEDISKDILSKEWIPRYLRWIISFMYNLYERYTCSKFDAIIAATPFIRDKFLKINKNTIDINNYPILSELSNSTSWDEKKDEICYIGGISRIRGAIEIVKAMEYVKNAKLNIAGSCDTQELEKDLKSLIDKIGGGNRVNLLGFLGRQEVSSTMCSSKMGLVTLHPIVNYLDSLPIKMFEYMCAGIPVIASNFKLWREIVENNNCGICVNPLDPKDIAKAINFILQNPQIAKQMGENGKKAVAQKYNWDIEEKKLFALYKGFLQ